MERNATTAVEGHVPRDIHGSGNFIKFDGLDRKINDLAVAEDLNAENEVHRVNDNAIAQQ
jgi:hypothetical protein